MSYLVEQGGTANLLFVVPPAKSEEMYHPETFGRTGADFVNVE